jgi:hypothetical protein
MTTRLLLSAWVGLLFLAGMASAPAAEIKTKDGKIYRSAVIVSVDNDVATEQFSGGLAKVPLANLSEEDQARARDVELKRKSDEIEKLRQELSRQEQQLNQLKRDNEALKQERARTPPPPAVPAPVVQPVSPTRPLPPPAAAANPSKPLIDVPPVTEDQVVEASDLGLYYRSDPTAADARFKGKVFRVRGTVKRFAPKVLIRDYHVIVATADPFLDVSFLFGYRPEWKSVYSANRGRDLVATVDRGKLTLMKSGEVVTIQGECEGLKDNEIVFNRSRQIR